MHSIQGLNSFGVLPGSNAARLSETVNRALLLTGASGAAIALQQDGSLVTRARAGWNAPDLGSSVDLDHSFAGLCLKTGRTLYCDHLETEGRANAAACRALDVASMAVTPVREAGATVGILAVFSRKPNGFTDTHRLALEALAWTFSQTVHEDSVTAAPLPVSTAKPLRTATAAPKPAIATPAISKTAPVPTLPANTAAAPTPDSAAPAISKPEPKQAPPAPQPVTQKVSTRKLSIQTLGLNVPMERPSGITPVRWGAAFTTAEAERTGPETSHILRFRKSERMLHWSIAIPFLVCFATALVLVIFYNPHPQRHYRLVFSLLHRFSGACLMLFPALTALRHRRDHKIHLYNIREALTWVADDVKWLFLMGAAAISSKVSLPEQGKFNAAEKLNFIMVMCTYPLFLGTGLVLSIVHISILSWILHVGMAAMAAPLMLGHIFMATINPETRVGLSGMLTGYVDRHWARHHYTRWYREHFERDHAHDKHGEQPRQHRPPLLQCPSEAK